jgi:uncharacterized protein YecA (UPF0149 family)
MQEETPELYQEMQRFYGGDPAVTKLDAGDRAAEDPWRDVGRNDPCPCGSGKKFKRCCGR